MTGESRAAGERCPNERGAGAGGRREPEVVTGRGVAAIELPRVIVDAGAGAVARYPGVLRGADRERADAAGVRAGGGAVSRVVRGARPRPPSPCRRSTWLPTSVLTPGSAPTVKQHLAAIRMLCDWLVVSQVLPVNPAAAVRGPKHVVTKGSTPVLYAGRGPEASRSASTRATLAWPPGPGALLGDALQLRAGERGPGDEEAGLLSSRGAEGGSGSTRRAGRGMTSRPITGPGRPSTSTLGPAAGSMTGG